MIPSEFASSSDVASSSPAPKFQVKVVEEASGTTRVFNRPGRPEAASAEKCVLFVVTPLPQSTGQSGFDDFDRLAAEVALGSQQREVAQGRKWVAEQFGTGDLASLRLAAGLSQSELAVKCGIEQPHISRYESGRHEPLATMARSLARALGVSTDTLVDAWGVSRAANDMAAK